MLAKNFGSDSIFGSIPILANILGSRPPNILGSIAGIDFCMFLGSRAALKLLASSPRVASILGSIEASILGSIPAAANSLGSIPANEFWELCSLGLGFDPPGKDLGSMACSIFMSIP